MSSSGSIPVVLSVTAGLNQGDLQGQTEDPHSLRDFTKANDPAVADNAAQNGRDRSFITAASGNAFTYLQHGWGVQAIEAVFSINEPRGFSGSGSDTVREYIQSFPVIVANTVDTTSASDIQLSGFSSSSFGTLGTLATATNTGSGTVTFADNDLLFDTITGALGAGVTATGVAPTAPTGLPALTFATNPHSLTSVSGSENLAQATLTYGLTLSTNQLDALLKNVGTTNFPLNLAFNDGGAGTAITSGLNVEFALDTEDPTVPADAIPDTTVAEESAVAGGVLGTLTFTDGDIVRAGVANYTLSVSVVRQGTSDSVDGLLAWSALATTSTAGQATADLIYSKALDDAEVGVYTVTWALMDSTAADSGQSFFTGQEFTLTVNRLDDLATDGAITFADTGSDLIINTNTNRGKTFPISLAFTDRDFLEPVPPLRELTSVTYESVDFTVARPTGAAGTTTCSLSVGGSDMFGSTLPTPAYDRASGVTVITSSNLFRATAALTFANIESACSGLQIGTQITGASFKSVTVANDGVGATPNFVGTGTIATTFANPYTIQGYRQQTPDINVNGYANDANTHAVKVSPNGDRNITVTIIDRDPDDGTPTNPNPANTVRTGGTGASWPSELSTSTTCNSAQIAAISTPNLFRSEGANTEYDFVLRGAANAIGTCSVTILAAGEDGQFFTPQVLDITFEAVPTFNIPAFSLPADIDYAASFIVDGTVTSGDDDDGDIALSIESNSAVCDATLAAASVAGNSAQTPIALPTITVTPKSPGLCTLVITGNEGGAIESVSPSINFPELAPNFTATSLTSVA